MKNILIKEWRSRRQANSREMINQERFNQLPKAETAESECKFMLNELRTFARCKLLMKARVENIFGSEKAFYGFSGSEIILWKADDVASMEKRCWRNNKIPNNVCPHLHEKLIFANFPNFPNDPTLLRVSWEAEQFADSRLLSLMMMLMLMLVEFSCFNFTTACSYCLHHPPQSDSL